jgi:O-antigen ligase
VSTAASTAPNTAANTAGPAGAPPRALALARGLLLLAAFGSFTSPPLANLAGVLALACLAAAPGAGARLRTLLAGPAARGVLALLAVMAAAMLWAEAPWAARFAAWWSWRPLLLVLMGWIAWRGDARSQLSFARWLANTIALCALASFAFRLVPSLPVLPDREPGVLLRDHVMQGMVMVAGVVLTVAEWKAVGARGAYRGLLALRIALMLANLAIVCVGRSGHVALLAACAALAFLLAPAGRRWRATILVGAAALVVLVSSPMVRERFQFGWSEMTTVEAGAGPPAGESSMGLRRAIWRRTFSIIRDHPLLGVGVGGFAPAYAARIPPDATGSEAARAKDTHNQYLHVQVEAGLPGTLAFLAMIALMVRQRGSAPWREAGVALLAAWLATSLFNSHFENFDEAHFLGVLLGALLAPAAQASLRDTSASTSS